MGVDLGALTSPVETEKDTLRDRTVALDTYNIIYQFMSVIRQADGHPLTDRQGRTTSHLSGLLYRTANMVEAGIEPVFVFDGKPDPLKLATLNGRRARRDKAEEEWKEAVSVGDTEKALSKAKQTSRMTSDVRKSSEELVKLLGFPIVRAPADGEAQAAYMCNTGKVWASVSQDYDSLLFGTPRLIRNLTLSGRRKIPGRDRYRDVHTELIDSEAFLGNLGITRRQLVDMCILMGTDFNTGIKGIGPKKALNLVRKKEDLEHILPDLGEDIPEYPRIREIFLTDGGTDTGDLHHREIDRNGTVEMLASYDFSADRVESAINRMERAREADKSRRMQKSLDAWF